MGVLLWWNSLGLSLAYKKGSFGVEAVGIGTQFRHQQSRDSPPNEEERRDPTEELMDNTKGMIRHADVRKLAGKENWMAGFSPQLEPFVCQLWASLYKDRPDDEVELVHWHG